MPIYRGSGGSGNSSTSANANQVAIDSAAAAQSAIDAAASAAAALVSENEAESAETNAETSETNASTSASNAATSETNAATSATSAATSATNAGTSETNAATSASNASTSETNAASSASSASTSETNAASSESTATTKAAEASTSATNASNSATASANSATASANSATASAASAAAAQAAQEAIDGLYLGAQASDPTVDLNGDPVTVGDWYFNTVINLSKIYDGSGWEVLTATGSVTSITGTGTVSGLTLTGTVTTSGNLTLGGTLSGITASQLNSQNISQWTNDSGYITSYTETDTLDSVTGRGATTTNNITVGNLTSTGIDDNATSTAITIDGSSANQVTLKSTTSPVEVVGLLAVPTSGYNYNLQCMDSRAFNTPSNGGGIGFGYQINSSENYEVGSVIQGYKDNNTSGDKAGGLSFSTRVNNQNPRIRMTISSSGNVGIGETVPLALLHVKATEDSTGETDPIARFERFTAGDNAYLDVTVNNSTNMIGFQSTGTSDGGFTFGGASTDYVTIASSGDVGIGTDSPSKILHVVATEGTVPSSSGIGMISLIQNNSTTTNSSGIGILGGTGANSSVFFSDADDADVGAIVYEHNNNAMAFKVNAAEKMRIDSSGKVGIGVSDPDAPLEIQSGVVDSEVLNVRGFDAGRGLNVSISNEGSITDALVDFNNELSNGRISWSLGGSEKMRIHSSGNVGIGTNAPSVRQETKDTFVTSVVGRTNPVDVLKITAAAFPDAGPPYAGFGGRLIFDNQSYNGSIYSSAAIGALIGDDSVSTTAGGSLAFYTATTKGAAVSEKMRIDGTGNITTVGSGNSSPQLNVTNSGTGSSYLRFNDTATTASQGRYIGSAGDNMVFGRWGVAEHLRIDSAGKMALTANSGGLQLRTGTSGQDAFIDWQFNTTSTNFVRMGIDYDTRATTGWMVDSGYPITLDYTTNLVFKAGGTEKARLDVNGNLLVGRSSTVAGATDYGAQFYNTGVIYLFANASGNDDIFRGHNSAGANTSAIEADGNYIDLSDERVKENITDAPDALSLINSMQVRSFDWIGRDQHQTYGFVAQELNSVFEEAVKSPDDEETMWGVRHSKIIPVLTKALQEAVTRIETLETEVAALKGAN